MKGGNMPSLGLDDSRDTGKLTIGTCPDVIVEGDGPYFAGQEPFICG